MKKTIPVLLFIVFLFHLGDAFAQEIKIGAAISYGGPLPTEAVDSSSTGTPLLGATVGLSFSFQINKSFSFIPGLYYSFKGLDYASSITQDTLITIEFNGTSGQVPSFYTAYIDGKMRLHYLDIPLLLAYRIRNFEMMFGPYVSLLLAGKDDGDIRVVIGTGGVFDDYYDTFDNSPALRKMEVGIMLGSIFPLYKNLGIETKVTRSFTTLYNLSKLDNNGQGIVKMYNTYFQLGLVYKL